MEGHFITGFGDGGDKPVREAEPIELLPGASDEADRVLDTAPDTVARVERVIRLSEGFESAYEMELLASVHWVVTRESADASADPVVAAQTVVWHPVGAPHPRPTIPICCGSFARTCAKPASTAGLISSSRRCDCVRLPTSVRPPDCAPSPHW